MVILINCSNLKIGGGLQVADSFCRELGVYNQHKFEVVLSSELCGLSSYLERFKNINVYHYDIKNSFSTLIRGRDVFLDALVFEKNVDVVFTIFGPSRWEPICKHLCGFATGQLVLDKSPYVVNLLSFWSRVKFKLHYKIIKFYYLRTCKNFYTENPNISSAVKLLFKKCNIYTVTNFYNQIYDNKSIWKNHSLAPFAGVTLLTITAAYPHKNLRISIEIAKILQQKHINFRFVFTITSQEFGYIPTNLASHFLFIGKVEISECPSLYSQSDIMFQPSLMECFSATYVEAMKMEVPILTTDLDFAHGLCGNAALYYSPLSAEDAAEKIINIIDNEDLKQSLVENGKQQLLHFDNYSQRADKLIKILETI